MDDDKVTLDEARRNAQHASVRHQIERNLNAEIGGQAGTATIEQADQVGLVAAELRNHALRETVAAEHAVARSRGAARISQFIDYAFALIYGLLAIRLVLALIAARPASGFVQFINGVTYPLFAPFRGIVASPTTEEGFTLALPVVIAIGVYLLLHAGINAMLRMAAYRKTMI
ncbi:MAG TPA: YggT family protein [Gemmatimonadales bacterium]|nr:YggT family protein [Gemmatimonadales bacterium]